MNIREFIQNFIEDMVKDAGFGEMPEEMKKIYAEKIEVLFLKQMGIEIMNQLSDEDLKEFKKMIEKNPDWKDKDIAEFCQKHVKSFPEAMTKVMSDFRKEYIGAAKNLERKIQI